MHEVPSSPGEQLTARTLEFCRELRTGGMAITPARVIDALRALPHVDCTLPEDYRLALRLNLAGSHADEIIFNRVFNRYFLGKDDGHSPSSGIRGESARGQLGHQPKALDQSVETAPEHYSTQESAQAVDLLNRWDAAAPPLAQIIRELARRLATRPSRRYQTGRHGDRIDLRRSLRRGARYGLELVSLAYAKPKRRRTRLVMLCDVSGSMDTFNPFLLQLLFGLAQALRNSRTLVFSTQVTDITAALRRRSIAETLREIAVTVRHWSGGTDIGTALAHLNRQVVRAGGASSTVAVIISDGYDNGAIERIGQEMAALGRHVAKVVWINPMYGASTFQVRAAGLRAALPHVDHFLPAFDAKALKVLVRELARV